MKIEYSIKPQRREQINEHRLANLEPPLKLKRLVKIFVYFKGIECTTFYSSKFYIWKTKKVLDGFNL